MGNDAAALGFVQDGRVDALFATIESTATMQASGRDHPRRRPPGGQPAAGTAIVTTTQKIDAKRDALVAYLRTVHQSMEAVMDPASGPSCCPKVADGVRARPAERPAKAKPVIDAIAAPVGGGGGRQPAAQRARTVGRGRARSSRS